MTHKISVSCTNAKSYLQNDGIFPSAFITNTTGIICMRAPAPPMLVDVDVNSSWNMRAPPLTTTTLRITLHFVIYFEMISIYSPHSSRLPSHHFLHCSLFVHFVIFICWHWECNRMIQINVLFEFVAFEF